MNTQRVRSIGVVLGGAALYFGSAQLGFALTVSSVASPAISVRTGVAVVLLWIGGRSLWPAILIGELVTASVHGSSVVMATGLSLAAVVEALIARELLAFLSFQARVDRVRDVIVLLLPAAWAPTLIGAAIGSGAMLVDGHLQASSAWTGLRTCWFGHATGIVVVAPLLFAFWSQGISIPKGLRRIEVGAFALSLAPIAYVAAGDSPEIALAALPILIWGALRFGQRGVATANAIVAVVGVAIADHGATLDGVSQLGRLLFTQDFLEVGAVTSLVLAAVMSQRERDTRELQATNEAAMALVEEQTHLGLVATAVAQDRPLEEVFALITRSAGSLLGASCAAILRSEGLGTSTRFAPWTRDGDSARDCVCGGPEGRSVPINVRGSTWGRLWLDATRKHPASPLTEGPGHSDLTDDALERYARLAGLAIAHTADRERLVELASTDPLTGLANQRKFQESLASELARCQRYETPLTVALIDIDNFKRINDVHGHRAGDEVLAEVSSRIQSVKRSEALVARIGGDELAMLIPECDAATAHTAIERIRESVAGEPILDGKSVTLSIGICDSNHTGHPDQLMELADRALYRAKAAGKDLAVTHQG